MFSILVCQLNGLPVRRRQHLHRPRLGLGVCERRGHPPQDEQREGRRRRATLHFVHGLLHRHRNSGGMLSGALTAPSVRHSPQLSMENVDLQLEGPWISGHFHVLGATVS